MHLTAVAIVCCFFGFSDWNFQESLRAPKRHSCKASHRLNMDVQGCGPMLEVARYLYSQCTTTVGACRYLLYKTLMLNVDVWSSFCNQILNMMILTIATTVLLPLEAVGNESLRCDLNVGGSCSVGPSWKLLFGNTFEICLQNLEALFFLSRHCESNHSRFCEIPPSTSRILLSKTSRKTFLTEVGPNILPITQGHFATPKLVLI